MNKIVVGIAGVARSGKNTFANIAQRILESKNLSVSQYALATELKEDCKDFVWNKCGIDVFTENTEEKAKIRPLLLWYGDFKRKETRGQYWIDKIANRVHLDNSDVIFVTDIRYKFYEFDECDWIKSYDNGYLIHIERIDGEKPTIVAENEHEILNDPRMRRNADIQVRWDNINFSTNGEYDERLHYIVETTLGQIPAICQQTIQI
jgi:hypothetical protein